MTRKVKDNQLRFRLHFTKVFHDIGNGSFRLASDDMVRFLAVARQAFMKLFAHFGRGLDKVSVAFAEFVERFLRTVTVHDGKGDVLFVI